MHAPVIGLSLAAATPFAVGAASLLFDALRPSVRTQGLVFHVIGAGRGWGYSYYRPEHFSLLLDLLTLHKWSAVTIPEIASSSSRKSIALTFDDGFSCCYETALPLLEQHGFKANVFPIAQSIGRKSDWDVFPRQSHCSMDQLRNMAERGHEIGSHSLSHADLCLLSDKELKEELVQSKRIIEDGIGFQVTTISFPFGSWNTRVWNFCLEAGYTTASIYRHHRRGGSTMVPVSGAYAFDSPQDLISRITHPRKKSLASVRGRVMPHFAKGTPLWMFRTTYDLLRS